MTRRKRTFLVNPLGVTILHNFIKKILNMPKRPKSTIFAVFSSRIRIVLWIGKGEQFIFVAKR